MATKNAPEQAVSVDPVVSLRSCMTPVQIERVFQQKISKDRRENHDALQQACNARALEIAPNYKRGHLLPQRTDKKRGRSAKFVMGGDEYKTGTWGNGPGQRYEMAYFEEWAAQKLRESGLRSKDKIDSIISWARSDYLWRSLRYLAG